MKVIAIWVLLLPDTAPVLQQVNIWTYLSTFIALNATQKLKKKTIGTEAGEIYE